MFFRRFASALAACIFISCAACAKKEPAKQYPFRGEVMRLDTSTNVAAIHNEKVPGWMDPMTMEYPVEDRNEFKSLHVGDRITATVNVSSDGFWLTGVKHAEAK